MQQTPLFAEPAVGAARLRTLPVLAEQSDIRYLGASVRSMLNAPEATGMPYWSLNPYVGCAFGCAYCYARYAHRYAIERAAGAGTLAGATREDVERMPAWLAFERRVLVKANAADVLRAQRRSPAFRRRVVRGGETVVIGTATDPYQPAERRFRITRAVLEQFAECEGVSVVIITKSPLITRDVDVLARLTQCGSLTVHLSLITLDRDLARRLEPRAPTPESRLRALARLREAGIDVGVNIMPVLPGITDAPNQLGALVARVADAGATHVNCGALRLQSSARERYLPFIEHRFPHLADRYRRAYAGRPHLGESYRDGLRAFMRQICDARGISFGVPGTEADDPGPEGGVTAGATESGGAAPWPESQLMLPL